MRRKRAGEVPATMKAAVIDRFGPPSVLKVREVPVPEIGSNEVLIALASAGVGGWDAELRAGSWATGKERLPLILGTDGAGTVAEVGSRVQRFRRGQRVWGSQFENPKGGFYAEYVAVEARHVGPVPRRLSLLEAGAALATGLTALQGIDDTLAVAEGETVLIFGASGAVGTLAVQFAKCRGARVLGSARTPRAAKLVRELGADEVFDPRKGVEALRALAPRGIDAVLALAGGPALEQCLTLLRPRGRVAYPNGVEPEPRRRKRLKLIAYDAVVGPRELARLDRAVDEARLRVVIAAVSPLTQAARAHARVEAGKMVGRVVLRIRDEP